MVEDKGSDTKKEPTKKDSKKPGVKSAIQKATEQVKEEQEHKQKKKLEGLENDVHNIKTNLDKLKLSTAKTSKQFLELIDKIEEKLGSIIVQQGEVDTGGPSPKDYDPMCRVGVSMALTKNLGDFNSCKANFWLEAPCLPDELTEMHEVLYQRVDKQLTRWSNEVEEGNGGN